MHPWTGFPISLLAVALLGGTAQGADAPDWPARIDAAVQAAGNADAEAWRRRMDRATPPVGPDPAAGTVHWGNLPAPAAPPQDILPMVERFQGFLAGGQEEGGRPVPGGLSVFVSLAMPRASLERLVEEAARTGATLVLRGMIGRSLTRTALAVQTLAGSRHVAWTIDPEAFTRFQVDAVPVFVLTRRGARTAGCGADACFAEEEYARLAGDVGIGYALDTMERLAPSFRGEVAAARGALR